MFGEPNLDEMTVGEKLEKLEWAIQHKDYGMYGTIVENLGRDKIGEELWSQKLWGKYEVEKRKRAGYIQDPGVSVRIGEDSYCIKGKGDARRILRMGRSREEIISMMRLAGREPSGNEEYRDLLGERRLVRNIAVFIVRR